MANVPNIPFGAFGEGRLPKRLRRRLRQQADAAARREFRPQIQGYRRVKRDLKGQLEDALAADAWAVEQASNAIQNVPLRGLHGPDRRMLAQGLAQMAAANEAALPSLQAGTEAEFRPQILGAQQDVLDARIDRTQAAAQGYNTLLTEARGDVEQYLRGQEEDREDAADDRAENSIEFKEALRAAARLYENSESFKGGKMTPQTEAEWKGFIDVLLDQDAVNSHIIAEKAVRELRRRLGLVGGVAQGTGEAAMGFFGGR